MIETIKDTVFDVAHSVFALRPPQRSLCVAVKATFTIEPNARECSVAPEQQLCQGDVHYDDDAANSLRSATDLAVIKPRGEFYLIGTCHPVGGVATTSAVRVRVGMINREIAVFGDRAWRTSVLGARMSDPARFESMPLRWESAFGGPGFAMNPVGRGIASVDAEGGPVVPLPNLEDPNALIRSPDDRPFPAALFPISPSWQQRARKLGTYDARWVKERWPWFAQDFDVAFFNACLPSQQIEGFFQGNEDIALTNLVKGQPRIQTRLPGRRARCFVEMKNAPSGAPLREVPLALDTIVVDTDAGVVTCVWRGLMDVRSDTADEVLRLFVCDESIHDRTEPPQFRARMEAKLAEDATEDAQFEPEPIPTALESLPAVAEPAVEAPQPRTPPAPADVEALRRKMLAAGMPIAPALFAQLAGAARNDNAPAAAPAMPAPIPRAVVEERYARGESLRGMDLSGVDLRGASMPRADFTGAILQGAVLCDGVFDEAVFTDAVLDGADLQRARFERARLNGAELTRANATGANFSSAVLDEAMIADATLAGATFTRASCKATEMPRARLERANFDGANLERADLSGATLVNAVFTRAKLPEADFTGVDATSAEFSDCDLSKLRAGGGAKFVHATLRNVRADGSVWTDSKLDRANFSFASLERADFTGASLIRSGLHACNLKQARFVRAKMLAVGMNKSDASESTFESADLSHADCRGSNFHGAAFWKASTENAQFELAILTGTLFEVRG